MAEWAKEKDFDEILQKANIIFGGEGNTDYFQLYHPKLYSVRNSATEHLIVRNENGIQGMLGVFPAEMDICGTRIKVDGFGTMGVMKAARGKGYMKDLMNTAVATAKQRSDIAFLGGRRQRYEYFGFTPSGISSSFSFNRDNARHGVKDTDISQYSFENAKTQAEASFACSLYNLRSAKVIRTEYNFITMLNTCRSSAIIIRKNGDLFGYASVNNDRASINEIELINIKELPAVLAAYIKQFELRCILIGGVFMHETEKLKVLDSVCENMFIPCCENFLIFNFVKIINALLALKSTYTRLYPCSTVVEIKGHGKIAVIVNNNDFHVYNTDNHPDVVLSSIEATRLLFGNSAYTCIRKDIPYNLMINLPLPLFYSRPDFV